MSTARSFDSMPPSGDLLSKSQVSPINPNPEAEFLEGDATLRFHFESREVAERVKKALVRTAGISDAQILRIKIEDDDERCSLKVQTEYTSDLDRLQKNIERIISECASDERSGLKRIIESRDGEGLN